jgi:tetratricopeptide (TPR) repeat protein
MVLAVLLGSCDSTKKQVEFEWKVYESAMEHNDRTTAIGSLNRIITLEKYNADALDTLCQMYLNAGLNNAALKVATRANNVRESDATTKVLGKANKDLGNHEQALLHYNKLVEKSPQDLEVLYGLAFCNINLGKANEAVPFIQRIVEHPESASIAMKEFYQNANQYVPYKAVALNMLGFLQSQAGQNEAAIKSYRAALSVFPDYYLAKNNLRILVPQK